MAVEEGVKNLFTESHLATSDYVVIVFYFISVLTVGIWVSAAASAIDNPCLQCLYVRSKEMCQFSVIMEKQEAEQRGSRPDRRIFFSLKRYAFLFGRTIFSCFRIARNPVCVCSRLFVGWCFPVCQQHWF